MAEQAYVIGDLHLGGGEADPELESFHQDAEFVDFVDGLPRSGTTLFLNGDFIEFLKIPPYQVPAPSHLLWTEATSVDKLHQAIRAHPTCFEALQRFVATENLRILIGNHDLDLAWPGVQSVLRDALGDPSDDRLRFHLDAEVYHGVHIEHGHAFTSDNGPRDPECFLHQWPENGHGNKADSMTELFLERVWGSDFVLSVFNDIERRLPFADKVEPRLTALYHGIRNRWVGGREFVRLMLFLKRRKLPLRIFSLAADTDPTPGAQDLIEGLEDCEWKEALQERLEADCEFRDQAECLIQELAADDRWALGQEVEVALDPPELDGLAEDEPSGRQPGIFGGTETRRELRAARERLEQEGVSAVVFGHTHRVADGKLDGAFYNPGTWKPQLNLRSERVRQQVRQEGITRDVLSDRSLWVVDRRAVHIEPSCTHNAQVRLIELPGP